MCPLKIRCTHVPTSSSLTSYLQRLSSLALVSSWKRLLFSSPWPTCWPTCALDPLRVHSYLSRTRRYFWTRSCISSVCNIHPRPTSRRQQVSYQTFAHCWVAPLPQFSASWVFWYARLNIKTLQHTCTQWSKILEWRALLPITVYWKQNAPLRSHLKRVTCSPLPLLFPLFFLHKIIFS